MDGGRVFGLNWVAGRERQDGVSRLGRPVKQLVCLVNEAYLRLSEEGLVLVLFLVQTKCDSDMHALFGRKHRGCRVLLVFDPLFYFLLSTVLCTWPRLLGLLDLRWYPPPSRLPPHSQTVPALSRTHARTHSMYVSRSGKDTQTRYMYVCTYVRRSRSGRQVGK